MKNILLVTLMVACLSRVFAQLPGLDDASDPVSMKTRFAIDVDSYIFYDDSQFYGIRPGYYYGLQNERHMAGISVPFVHNIFKGDYAGYENTTGFGDLKMTYVFVPYFEKNTIGIERVSFSLDVTAPTGESRLGRGVGVWTYKPGIIFSWRVAPPVVFYPEVRFQFSTEEANAQGGSDAPDPDDPEADQKIQNLSISFPATVQLEEWNGWFSLNAIYIRSLSESTDFFFLRSDIGKMMGSKSCASLRITKFITGQPRLNVVVQANFTFFMR